MSRPPEFDQYSALFSEVRWFVRLRWFAGLTVILGAFAARGWVDWSGKHVQVLVIGFVILAYNVLLWIGFKLKEEACRQPGTLLILAWFQILADLVCLTLVVLWTGGAASPLVGLFVLHMVFTSLLLPHLTSYLVAALALAMVFLGLGLTGQLPDDRPSTLILLGWVLTVLLTVFLTNHITASLRQRDIALRRQHRRRQAILETAADGIVTFDASGTLESVNPAAERMFAYPARELIGRNIGLLSDIPLTEADRTPSPEEGGHADGDRAGRKLTGRRRDGSIFPLEASVSRVRMGEGWMFTAVIRDVTERVRTEAELRALNEELKRQQEALIQHEKMAAMGQMAAGVAHEISNPLANIHGVLQLVERYPDRMTAEVLGSLREQSKRIDRIVRQMAYFAHPAETCWEPTSVNDLVEQSLGMIRFDHRIREVELVRNLSPTAGEASLMRHALHQVLVNIIINALDAVAGVLEPKLELATRREEDWCVIEVSDNGRGIKPENLERIFEPFFTTKPVGEGTGLGLSISYSLIERHGGRFEVESTIGQGTKFAIRLPIDQQPS